MKNSTIAAIATPPGSGGIGVIKISGPGSLPIADAIFKRTHSNSNHLSDQTSLQRNESPVSFKSHMLYYGHIVNPDNGRMIDEVLLTSMKAPRTYTREDVVEIQSHAGSVGLRAIMELVLRQGARLAEPGEFTKRAFLNGRIDLTQAEAVIDVINAKTDTALNMAATQLNGQMKAGIESMRNWLTEILAEIEAAIDFPDDVGEIVDVKKTIRVIQQGVVQPLNDLIKQYDSASILRDGIKLSVVGRPNVGKSSLLNRLVQKDRAIVTSIPGTTRDLIEETFNINGIPIVITDTAGLHETNDPIEVIGINKAHESIENADLILFMIDCSHPLTPADRQIYEKYQNRKMILIINKIDLIKDGAEFEIPAAWKTATTVRISVLYDIGINDLKDRIEHLALNGIEYNLEALIIPNIRHKLALEESLKALSAATQAISENRPLELIALDIKEAIDRLGDIIGVNVREDVIDQIFSRFCIGK
ncbi:MAG: tRNA uridine-5-carboxymethylaminomethyl(34) synthesis GTPase MnmE [Deltaproteobacteria bacterium]|nr:MAG: tRNA uridine-5-carboxymethylaminomethyl(34) synthesis GTPase MnmE [Deltaproteobacteria bacterium]